MKAMKKLLVPLAAMLLTVLATSCQKEQPATQQGNVYNSTTIVNGVQMKTYYYTVEQNQWQDEGSYLYAPFENADITDNVLKNGCVVVYLIDVYNRDNPLPNETYCSWTDDEENIYYYSNTFSYDVSIEENQAQQRMSTIAFKFQASDFENDLSLEQFYADYGAPTFKVCVFDPPADK